jgi:hypothetical protein
MKMDSILAYIILVYCSGIVISFLIGIVYVITGKYYTKDSIYGLVFFSVFWILFIILMLFKLKKEGKIKVK